MPYTIPILVCHKIDHVHIKFEKYAPKTFSLNDSFLRHLVSFVSVSYQHPASASTTNESILMSPGRSLRKYLNDKTNL